MVDGRIALEDCMYISIKDLKDKGAFNTPYCSFSVNVKPEGGFEVEINIEEMFINFKYAIGRKQYYYSNKLVKEVCNYGGYRYYFICPIKNIRVTNLYLPDGAEYFASKQAYNLCYRDQLLSQKGRAYKKMAKVYGLGDLEESIKYPYRNGKPTRKYRKYLRDYGSIGFTLDFFNNK